MDIKHEIDVDVPASFIFEKLTDVESITENLPSNVVLRSESDHSSFVTGSQWVVRAQRTGRKFALQTEITDVTEGSFLGFTTTSNRIHSKSSIQISSIDKNSSRVEFNSFISPKGLLGRILVQSLKASRGRVAQRLEKSGGKVKDYLEKSYRQ